MDPIQKELDRLVAGGLPGAFVYIETAEGRPTFRTAGAANIESGASMDPEMHYRIGSTTKTFTAVVTLQLVGEGRLGLDDLVRDRLPTATIPNGERLTIEHLLRMRSGLFDFEEDPALKGDLEAHLRPVSLRAVNDMALRGPVSFAPGERFEYCNSNFTLLEAIIERVTGRPLAHELQDRIIEPLGLQATTYPTEDDLGLRDPYIHGYERVGTGWRDVSEVFFGRGDGAIISTAVDTARFFRALLVDRMLLPAETLETMMTVLPDDPPPRFAYGLGLYRHDLPGLSVWGHSGGGYGYNHDPFVDMDTGRMVIVMRNASFGFHGPINEKLSKRLSFSPEFRASLY